MPPRPSVYTSLPSPRHSRLHAPGSGTGSGPSKDTAESPEVTSAQEACTAQPDGHTENRPTPRSDLSLPPAHSAVRGAGSVWPATDSQGSAPRPQL